MTVLPEPDHRIEVAPGRHLAVDDRGDPAGRPLVYLHGTPDSRLARHPDDDVARAAGVRLLAPDRPGIGASDPDPATTPASVADDVVAVLDALGIEGAGVLTWSAGSITGLALAGRHPDRVEHLTLAAPLVPADAYDDPTVLDGAGDARRLFAEQLGSLEPGELGAELAMWLVPPEIDDPTAREMLATSLDAVGDIAGAAEQLVLGLRASVARGLGGVERDIAAQATPLAALLDRITCPVRIVAGEHDTTTPPAMARWLAARLDTEVELRRGGHVVAITAWAELLAPEPSSG